MIEATIINTFYAYFILFAIKILITGIGTIIKIIKESTKEQIPEKFSKYQDAYIGEEISFQMDGKTIYASYEEDGKYHITDIVEEDEEEYEE